MERTFILVVEMSRFVNNSLAKKWGGGFNQFFDLWESKCLHFQLFPAISDFFFSQLLSLAQFLCLISKNQREKLLIQKRLKAFQSVWSNNCLVALTKSTHHAAKYQSVLYYTIWAQAKWKRNGQFSKCLHVVGSRVESLPRQPLYAWFVIAQLFFVCSETHLLWFSTLSFFKSIKFKNMKIHKAEHSTCGLLMLLSQTFRAAVMPKLSLNKSMLEQLKIAS